MRQLQETSALEHLLGFAVHLRTQVRHPQQVSRLQKHPVVGTRHGGTQTRFIVPREQTFCEIQKSSWMKPGHRELR